MNSFRAKLNETVAIYLQQHTGISKETLLHDVNKELGLGVVALGLAGAAMLPATLKADTAVVPAVAETPGANNSYWDTSVQVFNPTSAAVNATLTLYKSGNAGTFTTTTQIQPGQTATLEKILTQMGTTGSGALVITTPDGIKLLGEARLFNDPKNGTGTQGQNLPLYQLEDLLNAGESGTVFLGRNTALTRSNYGWFQLEAGTVKHDLVNAQGQTIATLTETYAANTHLQREAGAMFGMGLTDNCRVVSTVQSGNGIGYGSEVDKTSNDPTTKEMQRVTTNNPDAAAAYVAYWMPKNDGRFYLANHEIRAMINGGSGTRSYAPDMAAILYVHNTGSFSSPAEVEAFLRQLVDSSDSNGELWRAWDPLQWISAAGGNPDVRVYYEPSGNPGDFKMDSTTIQQMYDLSKTFLTSYVGANPFLYGGQAGGTPDINHNPTWNSQDPN